MASKFRLFTRRFFIYCNVAVVFFFLLSCLAPYLNPQKWWFISLLGLGFPVLLLLVLFFLAGWLIFLQPRLALLSGVALLLSFNSLIVFFALHAPGRFDYRKDPRHLRVASWNVARFIELKRNNNKGSQTRLKMFDLLQQQEADVVCLQEFQTSVDSAYYDNIKPMQQLGYPYYYFLFDKDGDKHFYSSIIFSRYPIVDSGMIRYPRPTLPDALIHADIKVNNDTVRIYTTHLQSLQFKSSDYQKLHEIKEMEDSLLTKSRTIFSKLKKGITHRSIQADVINEVLDDSPHPVLFAGDLNDVPNSYTYFTVRGSMQDAFLKKGFGMGRTFAALSPTLRIDYIFTGRDFHIRQFNRVVKNYSDHYMLVADVELRK